MVLLHAERLQTYAIMNPRAISLLVAAIAGVVAAVPVAVVAIRWTRQRLARRSARHVDEQARVAGDATQEPAEGYAGKVEEPISPERRRFFAGVAVTVSGIAATIVAVPFLAALFAPLRRKESPVWRPIGALDDFPLGETVQVKFLDPAPLPWAGFGAGGTAWVRREGARDLVAFTAYCTHVGCPVRWIANANLFMCPCHGGAFYRNGTVASGPPPAPLPQHLVRVRDGQVEIEAKPIPLPTEREEVGF